jgi:hypothetical protein
VRQISVPTELVRVTGWVVPRPTPLITAFMIDPAGDPTVGEVFLRRGVKVIPLSYK